MTIASRGPVVGQTIQMMLSHFCGCHGDLERDHFDADDKYGALKEGERQINQVIGSQLYGSHASSQYSLRCLPSDSGQ